MSAGRRTQGFLSHAATYAIGNILRRLVGFLMLPIYTHYLGPAEYGVVGLLTFALSVLEPIFGARLARAIPRFYLDTTDLRTRRAVIWGALILTGAVSVVTTIAIVIMRNSASQILFGNTKYALATGLFAVNMLSQPVEDTGMTYVRLQERSGLYLTMNSIKLAMQIVLNILLVIHWNLSVVGVILSGVISSVVMGLGVTVYVAVHEAPVFEWNVTLKMLRYCWPLWFSGIAGLYIWSSGALYLRILDSLSDVGLMELGLKFAAVGLLVWTPFFQHWEPMSYRYYRERSDGRKRFQVAFVAVSVLMFVVGLGVSIFSGPVIAAVAAPEYRDAYQTVPILAFCVILSSLTSFFHFGFLVTDRTKMHSASQYLTVVFITVGYLVLIPRFGLQGAVAAQGAAFAFNFLVVYFWSRRYYDPGIGLGTLAVFTLVLAGAYFCSDVLIQVHGVVVSLALKAMLFLGATSLITLTGIRAIRNSDPSTYASILLSLRKLSRPSLAR
jgi:O-antigen/teichoic acid export membrane protein